MESPSPALIIASRRRALTGSCRGLSRAYTKGHLVRVRTGVYYSKPALLALKAWERYAATVAAVDASDPSVTFCYLTALRVWAGIFPGAGERLEDREDFQAAEVLLERPGDVHRTVLVLVVLKDGYDPAGGCQRAVQGGDGAGSLGRSVLV